MSNLEHLFAKNDAIYNNRDLEFSPGIKVITSGQFDATIDKSNDAQSQQIAEAIKNHTRGRTRMSTSYSQMGGTQQPSQVGFIEEDSMRT